MREEGGGWQDRSSRGDSGQKLLHQRPEVVETGRPTKKTRSDPVDISHSLRGITFGTVKIRSSVRRHDCVILGEEFPSWCLHVESFGFQPTQVLVRRPTYVPYLHAVCGSNSQVRSGSDWDLGIRSWPTTVKGLPAFVDGRLTTQLADLLGSAGIVDILSTQRPRNTLDGWSSTQTVIRHTDVGGVTDSVVSIFRHSKSICEPSLAVVRPTIPRDASTVLTQAVFGSHFRSPPLEVHPEPLRVVNLGTLEHPVYHGFGWLPGSLDRSLRVVIPVLNSPQRGGKWGVRRLSGKEVLLCKDVSDAHCRILTTLAPSDLAGLDPVPGEANDFLRKLLPGKCLVDGYHVLFNGGGKGVEKEASEITQVEPEEGIACQEVTDTNLNSHRSCRSTKKRELNLDPDRISSKFPRSKKEAFLPHIPEPAERKGIDSAGVEQVISLKASATLGEIAREKRERSAAKADDAEVPEYLWMEHLFADGDRVWSPESKQRMMGAAWIFRKRMLTWWKCRVRRSLESFLKSRYPGLLRLNKDVSQPCIDWSLSGAGDRTYSWRESDIGHMSYKTWWMERHRMCGEDLVPGADAVVRAAKASWWGWEDGSRPFHWRWPEEYRERIRDGVPVHFLYPLTPYRIPQADEKDPGSKAQLIEKLQKARDRRYISAGKVVSLTAFFGVKKGDDDVRPVYDGSVSGLNDSIWMPRFALPTIQTHLRQVEAGTFMCDLDLGEMFLNFILHEDLRSLTGVDLTLYAPEAQGRLLWECWQRAAMGLTSSPYQACQGMAFAEEVIRGDPGDPDNIFRWHRIRLNLPGSDEYNPAKPWVSKVREDDCIAVDFCTFVDDSRPTGPTKKETWLAARRIASVLSYLGLQDAPRKRRDSSRRPGAWTGSVVRTEDGEVCLLVGEDKWRKGKCMIGELQGLLATNPTALPRKRLEQIRGYLVHLAQTYPMFASYLIGLHMTIDYWRPNRDREGWRFSDSYVNGMKDRGEWPEDYDSLKGPLFVKAVPRLEHDLRALAELMVGEVPLVRRVRGRSTAQVLYGFGDASGTAFGATIQIGDTINYQYGQWSSEITESSSSNWRELNNLVCSLTELGRQGLLDGHEVFMFTDNSTAESAYWKGTSKSKALFELVLQMKRLEVDTDMILHVIHVSGRRMIAQGTDGLSRADHSQGVMQGIPIQVFVPLHLNPLDREPGLEPWLRQVTEGLAPTFLSPEGWFTQGHQAGTFVWTCAPAAAEVVVEQLGRARLKRPESMHLVVVPRIMTGRWRRHLSRGSEFYLKLDWPEVWDLSKHFEPVLIFLCLPYRACAPNRDEQEKLLVEFRRSMLSANLSEVSEERRRYLLRKLLQRARALCPL